MERGDELLHCHNVLVTAVEDLLEQDSSAMAALSKFDIPHISIASRLSPENGRVTWNSLKSEAFDGRFLCTNVLLLRQTDRHHPWALIASLRLAPLSTI